MAQKTIAQKNAKKYARDYVQYLEKKYNLPIDSAYLFGSFAKSKPRDWSDIDVCVISKKFNRGNPLVYLWTKLRDQDVDRGIEPYGLHPDDFVDENPIAYEIRKHGILLK